MKSYRVWEETSLHFWDQSQWGQWNPSTLEEKVPGVACLHPPDFWLPACWFQCAQAQTPRTSSSVSRLSPTLCAPGTSSASFPCAARQTAALSTAPLLHLLFPVCSFRGHSPHTRRPSQRKEAEAYRAYQLHIESHQRRKPLFGSMWALFLLFLLLLQFTL